MSQTSTLSSTAIARQITRKRIDAVRAAFRDFYGAPFDLARDRRREPMVSIRQFAMAMCRDLVGASYKEISNAFFKDDHRTAMHACEAAPAKLARDPELRGAIAFIRKNAEAKLKEVA